MTEAFLMGGGIRRGLNTVLIPILGAGLQF